jgi:excisionase family DNA binding protein
MSTHPNHTERRLLRVSEVAEVLGISRSAVYELVGRDRLESVHIGRSLRVPSDGLDRFVLSLREEVTTDAR